VEDVDCRVLKESVGAVEVGDRGYGEDGAAVPEHARAALAVDGGASAEMSAWQPDKPVQ
jgi:hypothetical protein